MRNAYRASAPVSPVRIRITCSSSKTKILPSPILPVLAAFDRFDHLIQQLGFYRRLDFHLGQKIDYIFGAAIQFGVAL